MRVPTDSAEVLPSPSPIKGAIAAAAAATSFAGDAANDAQDYRTSVGRARRGIAQGKSVALLKLQTKLEGDLEPGAQLLAETASAAKNGFATYAAEIERIHRAARTVSEHVDDHLATIRVSAVTLESILSAINVRLSLSWDSPPSPALPTPVLDESLASGLDAAEREAASRAISTSYDAEWRNAATAWIAACDGIGDEKRRWTSLIGERRESEAALLRTLCDTHLGTLIQLSGTADVSAKHLVAIGFTGEVWGGQGDRSAAPAALIDLLSSDKTPEEVARAWQQLKDEGVDTDALLQQYCFELAGLNGLPFADMDTAGRAALAYALDRSRPNQLEEAYFRMGFRPGERPLDDFRQDLEAVKTALRDAEIKGRRSDVVQLVSFGRHDGAVTAGISLGDLDSASTVGVFVSGMMSDVRGIGDAIEAFRAIRDGDATIAMVTWVGYRSPTLLEEGFQDRADAGGLEFASFLDGIAAQRADNPLDRFATLGHSYGTNVVAEALKLTDARVDAFVAIGSAGLKIGTTAADLGVSEIHATHASRDNIAQSAGRHAHIRFAAEDGGGPYEARVDPRDLDGAREFTSEKTLEGEQVTMHNLVHAVDWGEMLPVVGGQGQWLADRLDGTPASDEIGYLDPDASTVDGLYDIMRGTR